MFSSQGQEKGHDVQNLPKPSLPTAVVGSVDPIILNMKLVDVCSAAPATAAGDPPAICRCFPEELVMGGDVHRLYVTLGQFSIIRLGRIPSCSSRPTTTACRRRSAPAGCGCECQEDPCEMFRKVQFPFNEFFPPNSIQSKGIPPIKRYRSGCCS